MRQFISGLLCLLCGAAWLVAGNDAGAAAWLAAAAIIFSREH